MYFQMTKCMQFELKYVLQHKHLNKNDKTKDDFIFYETLVLGS